MYKILGILGILFIVSGCVANQGAVGSDGMKPVAIAEQPRVAASAYCIDVENSFLRYCEISLSNASRYIGGTNNVVCLIDRATNYMSCDF